MKNVYFVQVDVSAGIGAPSVYLPYTAGILVAAAWESELVKQTYRFRGFIFLRENVEAVADRMEDPAVVAFSCYCWSTEYNKRLAQEIKKRFPDCVTVFGGHNVPEDFSFLEQFPYIDVLSYGEGEATTRTLLEALAENRPLKDVPNIAFREPDGTFTRTASVCQRDLDFPSPYLGGWFDDILKKYPDVSFNAILETSRGCPYQCAYCDWGLLKSKVRLFPMERVKAEIRWMTEHKIAFVWGADANFGLFDRDLEIADELVKAKETTGYPERMRINYAKNKPDNVFAIVKKFKECDFDRFGATLSFQSLSPVVLKNIGRSNAELDFYKQLLTKYTQEGMKAYSELIIGLPGETYESFIKGVGTLFTIGQHFMFEAYAAILLPNSVMGQKDYVEKYGIKTVRAELLRAHFALQTEDIPEYAPIVVETSSMPRAMWVRANVFCAMTRAFHCIGLLRAFAVYLFVHQNLPYEVFYDRLLDYLEANPSLLASKLCRDEQTHAREQSVGKTGGFRMSFKPCGDVIWNDHEYIVLHLLAQRERFYEEILPYLKSYEIPADVFADLLLYQKSIIRTPYESECRIPLHYDVHGFLSDAYLNTPHPLRQLRHTLILRDTRPQTNWIDYGRYVLWYGRMGWATSKDEIEYLNEDE